MVKKNNDIEKLFRKGLKDQEILPSARVWSGVKRQLFRKMFMQFSPGRFNILYAALLAAAVITLALLYARPEQKHPNTMPENIRQEQPVLQAPETADSLAPDTLKVPARGSHRHSARTFKTGFKHRKNHTA